jgi:hypothetical protein
MLLLSTTGWKWKRKSRRKSDRNNERKGVGHFIGAE